MSEPIVFMLSAIVAMFMVALTRAGMSPNLRAAIRTTVVVFLGWSIAGYRYRPPTSPNLSWHIYGMLLVSLLAVIYSWVAYFRISRAHSVSQMSVIDRANVTFATLFSILFLWQNVSAQSVFISILIVSATLILAWGRDE